jgi:hypothetical protein
MNWGVSLALDVPRRAGFHQHTQHPQAAYPEALEEVVDNPGCMLTPVWGPHDVSNLLRSRTIICIQHQEIDEFKGKAKLQTPTMSPSGQAPCQARSMPSLRVLLSELHLIQG